MLAYACVAQPPNRLVGIPGPDAFPTQTSPDLQSGQNPPPGLGWLQQQPTPPTGSPPEPAGQCEGSAGPTPPPPANAPGGARSVAAGPSLAGAPGRHRAHATLRGLARRPTALTNACA